MSPRGFETFLKTISCWLGKATDAEVEALSVLVGAELTRRAAAGGMPPVANRLHAPGPADEDQPRDP